jgi:hypothetical protein
MLISKNGEIIWKSSNDDIAKTDDETSRFSKKTVGSCHVRDFSVATPSIIKTRSKTISTSVGTGYHISNPNP